MTWHVETATYLLTYFWCFAPWNLCAVNIMQGNVFLLFLPEPSMVPVSVAVQEYQGWQCCYDFTSICDAPALPWCISPLLWDSFPHSDQTRAKWSLNQPCPWRKHMWPLFSRLCEKFSSLEYLMQFCVKIGVALWIVINLGAACYDSGPCKGENIQKMDGPELMYEQFNKSWLRYGRTLFSPPLLLFPANHMVLLLYFVPSLVAVRPLCKPNNWQIHQLI